ncbi:MAG: DUF1614 domain-containing protein [Candidatus Thermoplasmatota archaeon]|nr:DUF1614 domain-containing protein [Candidatus Thermoplasmatota archaeon]
MITFGLLVLFLIGLFFYILYSIVHIAFVEVGFSRLEGSFIVFGSIIFGLVDLPLFTYNNWIIAINIGGAAIPIIISIYLIMKKEFMGKAIIGILIVSFFTYNITEVSSKGVTSSFPFWLLPPVVASIFSLMTSYKRPKEAAPLAYVTGTLGVLIGADFFHLPEILRMYTPNTVMASIGGAAIFDMVFLAGIIAVLVDSLFIIKR